MEVIDWNSYNKLMIDFTDYYNYIIDESFRLAQILQRQGVHIVAGSGGVEHIGGQHGIGKRARH